MLMPSIEKAARLKLLKLMEKLPLTTVASEAAAVGAADAVGVVAVSRVAADGIVEEAQPKEAIPRGRTLNQAQSRAGPSDPTPSSTATALARLVAERVGQLRLLAPGRMLSSQSTRALPDEWLRRWLASVFAQPAFSQDGAALEALCLLVLSEHPFNASPPPDDLTAAIEPAELREAALDALCNSVSDPGFAHFDAIPPELMAHVCAHEVWRARSNVTAAPAKLRLLPRYCQHLGVWLLGLLGDDQPASSDPGDGQAAINLADEQSAPKRRRRDPEASVILQEWRDCCHRWRLLLDQSRASHTDAVAALRAHVARLGNTQRLRVLYLSQLAPTESLEPYLI